jgi:hypothetical protein
MCKDKRELLYTNKRLNIIIRIFDHKNSRNGIFYYLHRYTNVPTHF